MTQYENYKKILTHYGIDNQFSKLVEELKELSDTIMDKANFDTTKKWLRAVNDEIADVEVMIEQIKIYFNSQNVIDSIKSHKVERTLFEIEINTE